MTFAAIDWLSISINLLLVIFVIVCLLMTLLILMQRPKQEGLGAAFGAGVTDQVFGARTTNVLQRGTVYLGSMFFILALTLAVLIGHKNKQIKVVADKKPAAKVEEKQPAAPQEELKPKSLSEELPAGESPLAGANEGVPPAEESTPADASAAPETPAPADAAPADETVTPPADAGAPADEAAPADGDSTAPEEKSGEP
jgi:preprotein translocase subunit SecG